jgi:hypothetical protein
MAGASCGGKHPNPSTSVPHPLTGEVIEAEKKRSGAQYKSAPREPKSAPRSKKKCSPEHLSGEHFSGALFFTIIIRWPKPPARANRRSSNTNADTAAAAASPTLPPPPPPPLRRPLSIRRRRTPPSTCSIAAAAARRRVMDRAALLSAGERSDKAPIDDFERRRWVKVRGQRSREEDDDEYQSRMDWGVPEDVIAVMARENKREKSPFASVPLGRHARLPKQQIWPHQLTVVGGAD